MELAHDRLQILLSSVPILLAAIAALVCDFLKRRNEQMRELTIELQVRREEEQKRSHVLTPRPAERAAKAAPKERTAIGQDMSKEKKRTVNSEAMAVMERGAALAGSNERPRLSAKKSLSTKNAEAEIVQPKALLEAERSLPAGFHAGFQNGSVLNKLVRSGLPVSGLVVSIGVNASRPSESIPMLVKSLIGPGDFAAPVSEEEFVLIYPRERGAAAQKRLSQIDQQLWDFQLRSLTSLQISFGWGGVEVSDESIGEAIASASGRMMETKRARKLPAMEPPESPIKYARLRRVV